LMEAGDVALYEAKRAGRNTVRMYKVDGPPAMAVEVDPVG
jgi:hypothetical protein